MLKYNKALIQKLNKDLETFFPHLFLIDEKMKEAFSGVARLVMLDRYAQKDSSLISLGEGDLVIVIINCDPKFPTRGIGYVKEIIDEFVLVELDEDYLGYTNDHTNGIIKRGIKEIEKPLELYFEQIARRLANHIGQDEDEKIKEEFYAEISNLNLIPAGRVLFGAGSLSNVTYFNCFVMPYIHDSRTGIAKHREQVMEIMSRGGGVGTNGSTLRPKSATVKGVSGKSSGSVSWLNDLSELTHLIEQGGSRRGAQMIMLSSWHPDIIEFIVAKMQNPHILRFLIKNIQNETIIKHCKNKLKFTALSEEDSEIYHNILKNPALFSPKVLEKAQKAIEDGGIYSVNNPEFLSGANISVAITNDFMQAVKSDSDYDLKFPDLDSYTAKERLDYDKLWQETGDVREWEKLGYKTKIYLTIKARDLWNLINICATYSAEPGIFFLDNANIMSNSLAYNQKIVCTNPCGEQPLSPYSVCNLAAINLANMVNKELGVVDYDKLAKTITSAIRFQDNVIDKTHYFLEENKTMALGERRIGLGVMGLHDLLIWCNKRYGAKESDMLIDELFKFIATNAYKTSISLAKEKGVFPFLKQHGNESLLKSGFIKKLPAEIQELIKKHGLRNSHLLTIAPTGSTGTMIGVSTGLEPYFAYKYYRSGRLGKYIEVNAEIITEYIKYHPEFSADNLPDFFVSAMELSPEEHSNTQCLIQRWVDSSISKTVNAPKGFSVEAVENIYMFLYDNGAKGGTVYVDGSRDAQVLTLKIEKEPQQLSFVDLGLNIEEKKEQIRKINHFDLRSDRLDREIGLEEGNICPLCKEGIVKKIAGCNTCTNCNSQLKCDI